tara:strand:- start:63 stop:611 length:549 start_codon:yes stop_codon:yes gene_type:complete
MVYRNQFDKTGQCSKDGHKAEKTFEDLARDKGYLPRKATRSENMFKHVDYFLTAKSKSGKKVEIKVDVKARKKTSRRDAKYNDDWQWIEFKNVQGNAGWVHGDADFIVFERVDDFIFVNRKELVAWLGSCKKIRYDLPFVNLAKLAKYKIYQRRGRRDEITQIKTEDILNLESAKIWKKVDG